MASTAPAWTSTSAKPPPGAKAPRRRCLCACLLVTAAALLALALALTVLRVRDPTTRLVSTRLAGVAPRLTLPSTFPSRRPSLQLNVTLLLTVAVHNPNAASFAYDSGGHADLLYRGARVGEAEVEPGRVPSRGDAEARIALTVQADLLAAHAAPLVADVEAGSLPVETSARIPGRVTVLGVFRRRAVAYSDCRFVLAVADMRVRSQDCTGRTKL